MWQVYLLIHRFNRGPINLVLPIKCIKYSSIVQDQKRSILAQFVAESMTATRLKKGFLQIHVGPYYNILTNLITFCNTVKMLLTTKTPNYASKHSHMSQ